MDLIKYEQACRAVADAKNVDEVREYLAGAEAAKAYARQAKNRQLELDAIEIRTRAERRLGEMILDLQNRGHCKAGTPDRQGEIITLKDLGIDSSLSQIAQRLALVERARFEREIEDWRETTAASTKGRVVAPLQYVRSPGDRGYHQRVAARLGRPRKPVDEDLFSRFIGADGRRIPDWRVGELRRLGGLFTRSAECAKALLKALPAANADALATVEMVFKRDELLSVLEGVFTEVSVETSDAGLNGRRLQASRKRRTKTCEHCRREFMMKSINGRAGRFCSRECAFECRRAGKVVGVRDIKRAIDAVPVD